MLTKIVANIKQNCFFMLTWHRSGRWFSTTVINSRCFTTTTMTVPSIKTRKSPKLHFIFVIVQCHIWWAQIDKMGQTMKIEAFLISRKSLKISEVLLDTQCFKTIKSLILGQNVFEFLRQKIIVKTYKCNCVHFWRIFCLKWDIFDPFQRVWNPNFSNWIVHTLKSLVCL